MHIHDFYFAVHLQDINDEIVTFFGVWIRHYEIKMRCMRWDV